MSSLCGRRQMMTMILAGTTLALAGCGSDKAVASDAAAPDQGAPDQAAAKPPMLVYRSESCGCCGAWVDLARAEGYDVRVEMLDDMNAVKSKFGVPADMASCHTVLIGGYVLEGHVPFDHVAKLLAEQPKDIIGIAVPGMPRGSPGMEMPDGSVDEYQVMGFARNGQSRIFSL